jgi:hypothetical protein
MPSPTGHRLGIVSDTHGLLRAALVEAFAGVDRIIHAGDVGSEAVLDGLQAIAPVTAVRGNMDRERWAAHLRRTEVIEVGQVRLYVLHDLERLGLDPAAAGFHYYLKAIPWLVDGFSVQTHLEPLLALQDRLERGDGLVFEARKYLVEARKPGSLD